MTTTALLEKLDKPDAWDCVAPDTSRYIIHAQGDRTPEGWVSYQPLFALTPSDLASIKAALVEREELREALSMISAEAKESNEPIGRSVFKALATCGEIADVALNRAALGKDAS